MSFENGTRDDLDSELKSVARAVIRSKSGVAEYVRAQEDYVRELDELTDRSRRMEYEEKAEWYRTRANKEREKLQKLLDDIEKAEEESQTLKESIGREEARLRRFGPVGGSQSDSWLPGLRCVGKNMRGV